MPDKYAGKRVRCPGCDEPQRVPEAGGYEPPARDLSVLESSELVSARKLREVLIGCGSCGKTIRLNEARLGKTAPCPSRGVVLSVDAFNLGQAQGDVVDLSHLELEPAEPLLDPGASRSGSTLGGSGIMLDDSSLGSASGMSGSFSPGAAVAANAQEQLRELRDLNELKHSGAISNAEYKQRKAEIYSGRSLVVQATSRSADGGATRNRPVLGRYEGGTLPGSVKALIGVAVAGLIAFVLWSTVLKDTFEDLMGTSGSSSPSVSKQTVPSTPAAPLPATPVMEDDVAPVAPVVDDVSVAVVVEDAPSEPADTVTGDVSPDGDEPLATAAPLPDEVMASAVQEDPAVLADPLGGLPGDEPAPPRRSIFDSTVHDDIDGPMPPQSVVQVEEPADPTPAEPVAEPPSMKVLRWAPRWPEITAPSDAAIGKACSLVKQIELKDEKAMIGIAVGPPAEGLLDPIYIKFADDMQQVLIQTANDAGVLGDMTISPSRLASRVGVLDANRVHARHNHDASVQATIVSGVQDGYCVSYWFAGSRRVYPEFAELVGTALLVPEDEF